MAVSSIGPYRILHKLGEGGMGEVYLAEDTRLGRKVALKSLTEASLKTPDARQRLLHEARAAATLNHPNIAAIYDVLQADDHAHIVMEYVEGETLAARMRRGRVPLPQALEIAAELASALTAAHRSGVVHRDLKPANVHLTRDGTVKVLDFGLAQTRPPGPATSSDERGPWRQPETEAGRLLGTPGYTAPEQLLGRPADARSDIYSFGVVLYELLTGRRPFEASDFVGTALAALTERLTPPVEVDPTIPRELSDLVLRAMAREPHDRFESAAEIESGLARASRALGEQPTRSTAETVAPSAGRRRAPWVAAAAAAIAVAVGVAVAVYRLRVPPPAPGARPIVAVLPLENLSGDASKDHIGIGIAETLTTDLARVPRITVVSRAAAVESRQRMRDPARIARDLGVTFVVDGGVQQSGDQVRVTLKLVKPDGSVAWGEVYEARFVDLFPLQRRLAETLTSALQVRPSAAELARFGRPPTQNVETLADYWRGRALLERPDVKDNVARAVDSFERAIQTDPRFALAHAGLAEAYWTQYQETKEPSWTTKAIEASHEALRLDPEQPQVRMALATVYQGTGRREAAVEELRRALALQPNNDDAHRALADVLFDQGQTDEAIAEVREAIGIRPGYWRHHLLLGFVHFQIGRYADAAAAFRRVTELQPDNARGFSNLGAVYQALGDTQNAMANYRRALELAPTANAYTNLGTIYRQERRHTEARHAFEEAIKLGPTPLRLRYLGDALRRLGQRDEARASYLRAVELAEALVKVNPQDGPNLAMLAVCEAKLARVPDARRHATEAVALSPGDKDVLYRAAIVHSLGGRSLEALAALRDALSRGFSPNLARDDEDLEGLRNLPEFKTLVEATR